MVVVGGGDLVSPQALLWGQLAFAGPPSFPRGPTTAARGKSWHPFPKGWQEPIAALLLYRIHLAGAGCDRSCYAMPCHVMV